MSGINPGALFYVNQIEVLFRDDIGNSKIILGTGFWLQCEGGWCFVTNAHNINPKMKLGPDTKYVIDRVRLKMRSKLQEQWQQNTGFKDVANIENFQVHPTADVALLKYPIFKSPASDKPSIEEIIALFLSASAFLSEDLADEKFLANELRPMDIASFLGFPGANGVPWYDEIWQLAIARTASIASLPGVQFTNSAVRTTDTVLVSGLSFSGSSGSPIISHEKGIRTGPGSGLSGPYTPPKLIGIMSGHWWNDPKDRSTLQHSGLSYFTRSTAIVELLDGSAASAV